MWVTTLTFNTTVDHDTLNEWAAELEPHDASVFSTATGGCAVTFWTGNEYALTASNDALEMTWKLLPDIGEPIGVETVTEAEYTRRADAPTLPELVSAPDVGDMLGVSRQRVYQLSETAAFPEPLYRLRTGPVWDARAIDRFVETWERKPGRPSKTRLVG